MKALMSVKKKVTRRKWAIKEVKMKEVEITEKDRKKMVEVMADIFYHRICQPQEDLIFSDNSICKTLENKAAA